MELVQHPKGDNKFLTVAELLELADACRKYEVDTGRAVLVEGMIGLRNELRGLRIKS
jgi:hypothetical protein